jgi:hypothetical protein
MPLIGDGIREFAERTGLDYVGQGAAGGADARAAHRLGRR